MLAKVKAMRIAERHLKAQVLAATVTSTASAQGEEVEVGGRQNEAAQEEGGRGERGGREGQGGRGGRGGDADQDEVVQVASGRGGDDAAQARRDLEENDLATQLSKVSFAQFQPLPRDTILQLMTWRDAMRCHVDRHLDLGGRLQH